MEGESGDRSRAGLRRREFLIGGAARGSAVALPAQLRGDGAQRVVPAPPRPASSPTASSSGFPTSKAITLWTRVSELDRTSKLTLEVAKDKNFHKVVKTQPR